jgi:hypothetical protein
VRRVYEGDGAQERLLFEGRRAGTWQRLAESRFVSPAQEARYASLLSALQRQGRRTIEAVRRALYRTPT